MRDVLIIGAGPAGLAAAARLAAQGRDTLVLEEHDVVGRPAHCTGVLGHDAFAELDLPRDTILSITRSAAFRAGHGDPVLIESDRVIATVVDRPRFDAALAAKAQAAGAELCTGARVDNIAVDAGGVTARVRGGEPVRARAVVVACGANYRFNRALGLGIPRAYVQSAQVEMPFAALPHIDVRMGRALAPAGFAWAVPFVRGDVSYARLGLLCDTDARGRFAAFFAQIAREHGGHAAPPAPRMKMLPLGPVSKTVSDRVIAVGDAAGLVKPTTGGGIYYGLLSGVYAADTLDACLREGRLAECDLRAYEVRWRERIGPDIRAGLTFRRLASRLGDRGIHALVELTRVDGIVPLLKETADFNWHRRAALALLRHPAFRRAVITSIWS
ncbi:MAG TPA: NAD(P)/FAD-dependent oxidoreductase [Vicinamibacterales bacterium]|nr:NAD(P)/FAD-dependent oxidoreductase [Vicinamibacterales bacterium]